MSKVALHLLAATSFAFAAYYDWFHVNIPKEVHRMGVNFAGKLKYLTYWDVLIQTFYFTLCLVVDITNSETLRKIKDRFLATIAFPLGVFVALTFWGIYAVDRELILPKVIDPYFPTWLNHIEHTNVALFALIDMCTTFRRYPERLKGLKTYIGFMLVYLVWIHVIYFNSGYWVYPIMDVLSFPLRIVFFVFLFALASAMYLLGEAINNNVWAKKLKDK